MSGAAARLAGLMLAALIGAAACTAEGGPAGEAGGEPLLVMAAASLNTAMPELIARFREDTGTEADLVLGSTGALAAQIENGAPADVLFAADQATVGRLAERGLLRPGSVRRYAVGRLALVWRDGLRPPASLGVLADARFQAVAIANPEHAPYGVAAREALQHAGLWDALRPRLVQGENVAQAYQLVRTGNADAALVARSVLVPGAANAREVDPVLHAPVRQAAGVLARTRHPAAAAFLDFVAGPEGQAILARHGLARSELGIVNCE